MKVVVFASGTGSTFKYLAENRRGYEIIALFSNNRKAGALKWARDFDIPVYFIEEDGLWEERLRGLNPDYILLAGYLKIIPTTIIEAFNDRILNVHPSLLPKYGGKNFYGDRVHRAVLEAGDKETGSTIHLVDAGIDTGRVLGQVRVPVYEDDTVQSLAERVQAAEKPLYLKELLRYGGINCEP